MVRKPCPDNPPCPRCGATHVVKNGSKNGRQRWVCRTCNRSFGATFGTPRQHFTISDINPNNNTRARRRCLSHKTTSHASDRPARAANKHPNTYTNHNQHIPAAEPTRHQRHPKHPRPLPTKPLLHPHPIPIPRPTYRTRRQVRQPIPHILRPCAPKHH
jgi:ribosomal protein L37AE/L43A